MADVLPFPQQPEEKRTYRQVVHKGVTIDIQFDNTEHKFVWITEPIQVTTPSLRGTASSIERAVLAAMKQIDIIFPGKT